MIMQQALNPYFSISLLSDPGLIYKYCQKEGMSDEFPEDYKYERVQPELSGKGICFIFMVLTDLYKILNKSTGIGDMLKTSVHTLEFILEKSSEGYLAEGK